MLLMIVFLLTLTQKWSKMRETHPDASWLGPASCPEPEVVVLSSELGPSTGSWPEVYQEEKEQCQDNHSPDEGSSMGYASGGSSPAHAHEG